MAETNVKTDFNYKNYGISVFSRHGTKQYGWVTRQGKKHLRNYGGEIPNGLSILDLMALRNKATEQFIRTTLKPHPVIFPVR